MAIVVVQVSSVGSGSGSLTQAVTLNGVTAGNALITLVAHSQIDGGGGTLSVSDGVSYNADIPTTDSGGAVQIFTGSRYAVSAGSYTATATSTAGVAANSNFDMILYEVSGLTTNGFDQKATAPGNSTGPYATGNTGALAQPSEIMFALVSALDGSGATVPPTGGPGTYTDDGHSFTNSGQDYGFAHQIQSSGTAAVSASFGSSVSSQKWVVGVATYKGVIATGAAFPYRRKIRILVPSFYPR
jgi:hypothetical protein